MTWKFGLSYVQNPRKSAYRQKDLNDQDYLKIKIPGNVKQSQSLLERQPGEAYCVCVLEMRIEPDRCYAYPSTQRLGLTDTNH